MSLTNKCADIADWVGYKFMSYQAHEFAFIFRVLGNSKKGSMNTKMYSMIFGITLIVLADLFIQNGFLAMVWH